MSPPPFIDSATGAVDTTQLLAEAIPLAKLVGLVVVAAFVPFGLRVALTSSFSLLGLLLTLVTWFVAAVGTGLVIVYAVARGIHLARG